MSETQETEAQRWPEHLKFRRDLQAVEGMDAVDAFISWMEKRGLVIAKLDKFGADYVRVERPYELSKLWAAGEAGVDLEKYQLEEVDLAEYAAAMFAAQKEST